MVRLAVLSIGKEESIQIAFEGDPERRIVVGIDKRGNAFVSGPMNADLTTIFVEPDGLKVANGTQA